MSKMIITVDGPSGTGKSVTSRMLASKLNLQYIDSGIFYRATTFMVLKNNVKFNDYLAICKFAQNLKLTISESNIFMDGNDITQDIYKLEITNKINNVCKINALRRILNDKIKEFAVNENGIVAEGKDMGAVVFPEANYKFYLISDIKTRIARRHQDFLDLGHKISKEKIEKEIKLRDEFEMKKKPVILKKPENAIIVDTTNMIIEEQVNYLFKLITDPEMTLTKP